MSRSMTPQRCTALAFRLGFVSSVGGSGVSSPQHGSYTSSSLLLSRLVSASGAEAPVLSPQTPIRDVLQCRRFEFLVLQRLLRCFARGHAASTKCGRRPSTAPSGRGQGLRALTSTAPATLPFAAYFLFSSAERVVWVPQQAVLLPLTLRNYVRRSWPLSIRTACKQPRLLSSSAELLLPNDNAVALRARTRTGSHDACR